MDNSTSGALIGAAGAIIAALITAAVKYKEIILKRKQKLYEQEDVQKDKPELGPAELEPEPLLEKFMTDEYLVNLNTELELHRREGDELLFEITNEDSK